MIENLLDACEVALMMMCDFCNKSKIETDAIWVKMGANFMKK